MNNPYGLPPYTVDKIGGHKTINKFDLFKHRLKWYCWMKQI